MNRSKSTTSTTHSQKTSNFKTVLIKSLGLLIVVICLTVIVFAGTKLWSRWQNRETLARFLPAENTLAFAEINFDSTSDQVAIWKEIFHQHPYLSATGVQSIAKSLFPAWEDFSPFLTGRIGLALIKTDSNKTPQWLIISRCQDCQALQQKVQALLPLQPLLINQDFLFFAESNQVLDLLKNVSSGKANDLNYTERYQEVAKAIPEQNLAFIYYDSSKILSVLRTNPDFLNGKLKVFQLYQPYLKLFAADGFAIYLTQNNQNPQLNIQQISLFDRSKLPRPDFFSNTSNSPNNNSINQKYAEVLAEESISLISSSNLTNQKNQLAEIFADSNSGHTDLDSLIFSGQIVQVKEKILGTKISLENDFLPVLSRDFTLSLDQLVFSPTFKTWQMDFSWISSLDQPSQGDRTQKLLVALSQSLAKQIIPSKQEFILPDSTVGQILVEPQTTQESDQTWHELTLKTYTFGQADRSFKLYSVLDGENFLASTQLTRLEKIWTKLHQTTPEKSTAPLFLPTQLIQPSEFYQVNLPGLLQGLGQNNFSTFLKPFSFLSISRKTTQSSILTVYQLN